MKKVRLACTEDAIGGSDSRPTDIEWIHRQVIFLNICWVSDDEGAGIAPCVQ